jgi:hypothetical protein
LLFQFLTVIDHLSFLIMDADKPATTLYEEFRKDVDSQLDYLTKAEDDIYGKWRAITKHSDAFDWWMCPVWTVLLVSFKNLASATS